MTASSIDATDLSCGTALVACSDDCVSTLSGHRLSRRGDQPARKRSRKLASGRLLLALAAVVRRVHDGREVLREQIERPNRYSLDP